jgi:hypothetical protein
MSSQKEGRKYTIAVRKLKRAALKWSSVGSSRANNRPLASESPAKVSLNSLMILPRLACMVHNLIVGMRLEDSFSEGREGMKKEGRGL